MTIRSFQLQLQQIRLSASATKALRVICACTAVHTAFISVVNESLSRSLTYSQQQPSARRALFAAEPQSSPTSSATSDDQDTLEDATLTAVVATTASACIGHVEGAARGLGTDGDRSCATRRHWVAHSVCVCVRVRPRVPECVGRHRYDDASLCCVCFLQCRRAQRGWQALTWVWVWVWLLWCACALAVSRKEFKFCMDVINQTVDDYFPCLPCYSCGYLCCFATCGLSLLLPEPCTKEVRHVTVSWSRAVVERVEVHERLWC